MNVAAALKGTDLPPLPFESMESVGARLSWRNGKPLADMVSEMLARHGLKTWEGLVPFQPTDAGALAHLCGWRDARERARELFNRLRAEKYEWCYTGFRFCPICLEAGYHSYLFDWDFIQTCPMHGCVLTNRCQCCGGTVVPLTRENTLAKLGYRCARCAQFLAGAEPSLAEHIRLQEQSLYIEAAMRPYARFSQALMKQVGLVFGTWRAFEAMQCERLRPWCHADLARRTAAYIACFAGKQPRIARYRGFLCLRWRARAHWREDIFYSRYENEVRAIAGMQASYRATLRLLERWIFAGTLNAIDGARRRFFEADHDEISKWQPLVLTYVLLRFVVEGQGFAMREALTQPVVSRFLRQMEYCVRNGHVMRLGVRAYLLGMFAVIHAIVLRHQNCCVQELFDGTGFPIECILPVYAVEQAMPAQEGAIILPYVEGMPLWPFVRHTKPIYTVPTPIDTCNLFAKSGLQRPIFGQVQVDCASAGATPCG